MITPRDVQQLVATPEFERLLERSRQEAAETERSSPGTAAQVYRLLKGLVAISDGTTKPVRSQQRWKEILASGSAPRQSRMETVDGTAEYLSV